MKTTGTFKRGLTALVVCAVFVSALVGMTGAVVSAQGTATAAVAATPTGAPGPVNTAGCWTTPPTFTNGYPTWPQAPQMVIDPTAKYTATITTNKGDITFELYADKAPLAVTNFICLAGNGYYDLTLFHRILPGFVIQGGDPTATGRGGPGYKFNDELPSADMNYQPGTLAMANAGPNTNGSQFFICLDDLSTKLQKNYTIFGKVTGGMDVVTALAQTPVQANSQGEPSSPVMRVGIVKITVIRQ